MRAVYVAAIALLLGSSGLSHSAEKFERVAVSLERNIQDRDMEVKFEAIGGSGGLTALKVVAPDGRTVIDFSAPDSKLGIQHFTLESPEPKGNGVIQADFPEGSYRFTGTSAGGASLQGEARLSHKLPDPVSLLRPREDEKNVPVSGLKVRWAAAKDSAGYVVTVEDEKTGRAFSANVLAANAELVIPDGFLAPETEYKLGVGNVAGNGNKSFTEISFTTAPGAKPGAGRGGK